MAPRAANGCSSTEEPSAGSRGPSCQAAAASHAAEQDSAAAPALQHEWEAGSGSGVVGSELSDLFHEPVDMQVRIFSTSQSCGSAFSSRASGLWLVVVSSMQDWHGATGAELQMYTSGYAVCVMGARRWWRSCGRGWSCGWR